LSKIALSGNASGSGTLTLSAPNTDTDRTLTLPDAAGTIQVSGNPISGTTGSFSGDLSFNSGYGSAAVAYGCRAWCVFTGTGTVSLTGNGNVSSITDLNTGSYQVNFATALSDANYAGLATCGGANAGDERTFNGTVQARTTANCVITTVAYNVGTDGLDCARVYFAAFR